MDGFASLSLFDEDFDAPVRPGVSVVQCSHEHSHEHSHERSREQDERDDEIARLHALLSASRDEAYADGLAVGLSQAQAQHRDDLRRALDRIDCGLTEARQAHVAAAERASHDVAGVLLSALAAVMPELLRRHGDAEAAAVARAILPALLLHEPAVTIRCHPHTMPAIEAELAALEDDAGSCVRLVPADELPPGDVRLAWPEGRARRSVRELWSAVAEALAPLLTLPALPDDLSPTAQAEVPVSARRSKPNNIDRKLIPVNDAARR